MWSEDSYDVEDEAWMADNENELHVTSGTSVAFTLEEPMKARVFIFDGILMGLFFPIGLLWMAIVACCCCCCRKTPKQQQQTQILGSRGVKGTKLWILSFPFGSFIACIPLLCLLFWASAVALGLQIGFGPMALNLRDITLIGVRVSIGDAIVAITVYVGLVLMSAIALSHHPRLVHMDRPDAPFQLSMLPGDDDTAISGDTAATRRATMSDAFGVGPETVATTEDYDAEMVRKAVADKRAQRTQDAGAQLGLATLSGPKPRRYAPFVHVLFDEIPPVKAPDYDAESAEGELPDENVFIYDMAEWFEPQRRNRKDIDESLQLFKKAWSEEQQKEIQKYVDKRRRSLMREAEEKGEDVARRGRKDTIDPDVTILNPHAIEWRASDVFKFAIGDTIRRNAELPEVVVCFDGVNRVERDEVYTVSNRMWADRCALYCIDGAAETHQWQAIEGLFDLVQDSTMQNADGGNDDLRRHDRIVNVETLLLGMSGRDVLRRIDAFANGNTSSTVAAVSVSGLLILFYFFLAAAIALIPCIVRVSLTGQIHAKGTVWDYLAAYIPLALTWLSLAAILTVFEGIRRSLYNYRESVDSFTEVTLNAGRAQWAPVLNWYEATNIRTWFLLRQHILSAFQHHLGARVAAVVLTGLLFTLCWAVFGICYTLSGFGTPPQVDGWVFEAMIISVAVTISALRVLVHAQSANAAVTSHRELLAKVQAALEEEIMLVASRAASTATNATATLSGLSTIAAMQAAGVPTGTFTGTNSSAARSVQSVTMSLGGTAYRQSAATLALKNAELSLLLDAKNLLEDVRFAIDFTRPPLCPFGFEITVHHLHLGGAIILLNAVGIITAIVGWATNKH